MSEKQHKRRGPIYFMLDAWRDDRTNLMANVVIALSAWMPLQFLLFLIWRAWFPASDLVVWNDL